MYTPTFAKANVGVFNFLSKDLRLSYSEAKTEVQLYFCVLPNERLIRNFQAKRLIRPNVVGFLLEISYNKNVRENSFL